MKTSIPAAKFLGFLSLAALVAACGGRETPIRNAPQAVHPSTSALAQGTAYTNHTTAAPVAAPLYTPHANDGSQPIID